MNSAIAGSLPDFDSLWNYDKPAETEMKFRALLPQAQASKDTGYRLELVTQIVRTLSLQQKFTAAHALLDSIQPELGSAGERANVRYLLERGRTFNSSKSADKAVPLFSEAWNRALKAGEDFLAVDAAHMMAIAAPTGEHMEWNMKAVNLAEKSKDPKARNWLASLYNNIGWDYFDQKAYDSARIMFEKALAGRIEQKKPSEIRIARWCLAKSIRMLGHPDSALTIQKQLEQEWKDSGEQQDGYVFEEIAECLLQLKREEEAVPYFAQAYAMLSKDPWLARDEPERLERMKKLGRLK